MNFGFLNLHIRKFYSIQNTFKIYLIFHKKTLQGFRDKKEIEYIQIGGLVRYKKQAVDNFLEFYTNEIRKRNKG